MSATSEMRDGLNAPGVKVRPLEWHADHGPGYRHFHAHSDIGGFAYGTDCDAKPWHSSLLGIKEHANEDAARRAAERDHIAITLAKAKEIGLDLSALSATPPSSTENIRQNASEERQETAGGEAAELVERLRSPSMFYGWKNHDDYAGVPVPPSAIMLESAAKIEADAALITRLEERCESYKGQLREAFEFVGGVRGLALALAMSGKDNPKLDSGLMKLHDDGAAIEANLRATLSSKEG